MLNCKKISTIVRLLVVFALFGGITSSPVSAEDQSDPDFKAKYIEYLEQLPPPTALNGGQSEKIKSSFPNHRFPFTAWSLEIKEKNQFSFKPGEKLEVKGDLSYEFKGQENAQNIQKICLELNDNQADACKAPELFPIAEFKNLGILTQVWRRDESENGQKGDYLVDEFYALENGQLKDGQKLPFTLRWSVPEKIKDGDYYILLFVNQEKYFDLLGNPLTVFSEGARFDFGVEGNEGGVEIDKNNIKINGKDYAYRAPAPSVTGETVTVETALKNLSAEKADTEVKYELFRWGRTNPADLIQSKKESKTILANGEDKLSYTFKPDAGESVYDLKISLAGNSKSVVSVRFVIQDKNRGIVRFLSLVEQNGQQKPFFCVRNANWEGKFKGKIKLTVNDELFLEEEGALDAEEENCFIAKNSLKSSACQRMNLEIVDQGGKLTDSQKMELGQCVDSDNSEISATEDRQNNTLLIIIASILVLLSLGGILFLRNKAK